MALTQISTSGIKDATVANADLANEAVNEAKIQISNAGTNGQYLQKQSGSTGGLTWADVPAGVGGATGVDFNDNVKIRFGTDNDLEIYHAGNHARLHNTTGNFSCQSPNYYFNGAGGTDNCLDIIGDGAVKLYYDGSKKLETVSSGVQITDNLGIGVAPNRELHVKGLDAIVRLESTAATGRNVLEFYDPTGSKGYIGYPSTSNDHFAIGNNDNTDMWFATNDVERLRITNGGVVRIPDNGKFTAGAGDDFQIYHDGTHTTLNNTHATGYTLLQVANGEYGAKLLPNAACELYYDNSKKFATQSSGVTVYGDIDVSDGSIFIRDDEKLSIGTDDNLYIKHSNGHGKNFIVSSVGDLEFHMASSELAMKHITNGAVELYYDNSKKFETTSFGISMPANTRADFNGNIKLFDNSIAYIGTGNDLLLYHDGSHSYVQDNGAGDLYVQSNSSIAIKAGDENSIICNDDGAVELYYDNSKKLETKSTGVELTGEVAVTSNLLLKSSWSQRLYFGLNNDLQIYHNGTNGQIDNGTGNFELRNTGSFGSERQLQIKAKVDENSILCKSDGAVELYYDNSKKLETTSTGINITGGIRLGGNNAVNELDDYEEGEVTPSFTADNGTITLNSSYNTLAYTKVGRVVHVQGYLNISVSGVSGWYKISGLPFTPANLTNGSGDSFSTMTTYANGPDGNGYYMGYVEIKEGVSAFKCTLPNSAGKQSLAAGSSLTSSTDFILDVTYIAA